MTENSREVLFEILTGLFNICEQKMLARSHRLAKGVSQLQRMLKLVFCKFDKQRDGRKTLSILPAKSMLSSIRSSIDWMSRSRLL